VAPSGSEPVGTLLLIDLPARLTQQQVLDLHRAHDGTLEVRTLGPPATDHQGGAVRWSLVMGALVLTVVGIVIAAAFAVGARRQLVTLGQLSASGAPPGTVRLALVLQGTVTGVIGAAGGLALAAVVLLLGRPYVELALDERIHRYEVRAAELGAVVLIGVAAATVAALIPARTAARVPTLAALAGRRPLAPVSRRLVSWGVAGVAGGLALLFLAVLGAAGGSSGELWALVAIAGGVAELLGACALSPAVVSRLEPLARRLRGSLRLGARSLARHRARTGAVVSAVAAAGALAVAAGGLIMGSEARNGVEVTIPDDVLVVQSSDPTGVSIEPARASEVWAAVDEALPAAEIVPLVAVEPPGTDPLADHWQVAPLDIELPQPQVVDRPTWTSALRADRGLLDALRVGAAVRDGLAEAGVVVLTSTGNGPAMEGEVVATVPDGRPVPALAVPHRYTPAHVSGVLVSSAKAEELGLRPRPVATMFVGEGAFTEAERAALEDIQYDVVEAEATGGYTSLQWQGPDAGPSPLQLELILSGVALLFSLFVVGVSLALAAAESKDERDVLTIAGAPPGLLARTAAARAWLMAVLGALLAVPVGYLPVVVASRAQASARLDGVLNEALPLVFPTRTVLLLVVVVPAVVAVVSWASSSSAQRLRPVRVSTATFE
jgi:putative ABC transport system permease protein